MYHAIAHNELQIFKKGFKLIMESVRFNSRQTTMLVSTAILVYVYTQFVYVHTQHI